MHEGYVKWQSETGNVIENRVLDERWMEMVHAFQPMAMQLLDELTHEGVTKPMRLSVGWSNDAHVQQINNQFRQVNQPTNILAFEGGAFEGGAFEGGAVEGGGDLVLAYETVGKEAREMGVEASVHLAHLFVHGCLHLCGYDHDEKSKAEKMENIEINMLKKMNIANPYEQQEKASDAGSGREQAASDESELSL